MTGVTRCRDGRHNLTDKNCRDTAYALCQDGNFAIQVMEVQRVVARAAAALLLTTKSTQSGSGVRSDQRSDLGGSFGFC